MLETILCKQLNKAADQSMTTTRKGGTYETKVTIDGKEGYATVAMTTYADGSEEPTLPISLDGYSMYFYAE